MRKEDLKRVLDESRDVHIPIPIIQEDTAEYRIARKPAKKTRLIDSAESLDSWKPVTYLVSEAVATDYSSTGNPKGLSKVTLSSEHVYSGGHAVCFRCPTNLEKLNKVAPGRIYAVPTALRVVDRENWEAYNMLSAWVYPVAPGIKTITLRMQLHNDGAHKVPDIYDREGAHNVTLLPNQWNQMVLEIPYIARDCVTGVGFEYDMVGHENDACEEVTFFIDQLELKEVDCDSYIGWTPKSDRIVYSHCGYQPGAPKVAFGAGMDATTFRVLELETGRIVMEREIETVSTRLGDFQVMDFSDLMDEGTYMITAGQVYSRAFQISLDVWESSIWKVLNFFLAERCGYDVPGKHRACHGDLLLKHGELSIVANGGWHDAADVAQSLQNTVEGTCAMLALADSLEGRGHERLRRRVLEEAKWGMDYVLKMRFGDGWRGTYSSDSIWTDGIIGNNDDITTEALDNAFDNFFCAYAEAMGARTFASEDADYAAWCLKIAKEDYHFGLARWEKLDGEPRVYRHGGQPFINSEMIDPQVCSVGALSAALLHAQTGEESYCAQAHRFADRLLQCQQRTFTDWDKPMLGFFYQDRNRDLIWHHYHLSYTELPELALRELCRVFPDSRDYMRWYSGLVYSGWYYRNLHTYTAPYGLIPAGVYHEDEAKHGVKLQLYLDETSDDAQHYKAMVRNGAPLGSGYYVRSFPVWLSYRGNYNVLLSEAIAMNAGAQYRGDWQESQAVQDQFAFIIGQNPFGQSTMVGEGYDFVQHYAVQPGQSTGSLTVGMESYEDEDIPYWPQVNTATYKEVWICSASKWIWAMADAFVPGVVYGRAVPEAGNVEFTHLQTGKVYRASVDPVTGGYRAELPSGHYEMRQGSACRRITVVNNRSCRVDAPFYDLQASVNRTRDKVAITFTLRGCPQLSVRIRALNVSSLPDNITVTDAAPVVLECTLSNPNAPFVGLAFPAGSAERLELLDPRLL